MSTTLEWAYSAEHTLAVSGSVTLTIAPTVARTVNISIAKVSGGNVTAVTMRRALDGAGTHLGALRTVTLAAALSSAGDAVDADLVDESPSHVVLNLTVSASTVVRITARGVS